MAPEVMQSLFGAVDQNIYKQAQEFDNLKNGAKQTEFQISEIIEVEEESNCQQNVKKNKTIDLSSK